MKGFVDQAQVLVTVIWPNESFICSHSTSNKKNSEKEISNCNEACTIYIHMIPN